MPSFPKPKFSYNFDVEDQLKSLKKHKAKDSRLIPKKSKEGLLIATWNIANLGAQSRWAEHYQILAEIVSWFDVIAIQEINEDLSGIRNLESELPSYYNIIMSDKAGNNEHSAFIYDGRKVKLLEMVGEVGIPPASHRWIKIKGIKSKFTGFDRNPYLASFQWENFTFIPINVHLYFGKNSKKHRERRALEAYAIGRYADLKRKSKKAFSKNIIVLGDFNLPKVDKKDPIYQALTKRGLELPEHSTKVYSNINNDKEYDQIAFLPSIKSKIVTQGVFDFDNAIFEDLWKSNVADFKAYLRYYISDHRPLWMQLSL
jgi:endonuclease/exonuclease/phosphatase family metal-dependent hydrolase